MFREVHMAEVREVLRLWQMGRGIREIERLLGVDRKTVRRYVGVATEAGLTRGPDPISEEVVGTVVAQLRPGRRLWRGESWAELDSQRAFIKEKLDDRLRLTKIETLLRRRGVVVPYRTLHRFCVAEMGFGNRGVTVPVDDGEPGHELQVDFGRLGLVGHRSPRRVVKGLIFTAGVSRHQFCWPTFGESLEEVIEGFEEAWAFFDGIFLVAIVDNLKAIVLKADPIHPHLNPAFLEYAQARGFVIDTCRVRSPRDKPRVERAVPFCRQSGFAGEDFADLDAARMGMRRWSLVDAGMRVHGTTQRRPLEHFRDVEQPVLLPAPTLRYEVPLYAEPTVARDHHIAVAKALYSVPGNHIREKVEVRADRLLVKIFYRGQLIREHPRQAPGGRSTCREDLPPQKTVYAMRDIDYLRRVATGHGEQIGIYASRLLDSPLPWTRMRQVYRLLGLVKRWGAERVEQACQRCLELDVVDVNRVVRIVERAMERERQAAGIEWAPVVQLRFARHPDEFSVIKEVDPNG
jgi:transposase